MGGNNSTNMIGEGDTKLDIFFHFEKLMQKWYDPKTAVSMTKEKRSALLTASDSKIVEDSNLNEELLNCTLAQI